jgi:hypothetical protein
MTYAPAIGIGCDEPTVTIDPPVPLRRPGPQPGEIASVITRAPDVNVMGAIDSSDWTISPPRWKY